MKREQRFKFINSAQPKVMYTSHAPTTYFTWYMQSKRVRAFMFCGRVFMIAIFVFLFHIRCIYDEIYKYTCWSLVFSSPSLPQAMNMARWFLVADIQHIQRDENKKQERKTPLPCAFSSVINSSLNELQ